MEMLCILDSMFEEAEETKESEETEEIMMKKETDVVLIIKN